MSCAPVSVQWTMLSACVSVSSETRPPSHTKAPDQSLGCALMVAIVDIAPSDRPPTTGSLPPGGGVVAISRLRMYWASPTSDARSQVALTAHENGSTQSVGPS